MKRYSSLRLIAFAFTSFAVASDEEFIGQISNEATVDSAILKMTFSNTSSEALCLYHWPLHRDKVQEYFYGDAFLISDNEGVEPNYISIQSANESDNLNRKVYVVVPGSSLEAHYDLAKLYDLKPMEYEVSYYLSAVGCKAFNKGWPYMYSPVTLKGIVGNQKGDLKKGENVYKDTESDFYPYVNIYKMNPIKVKIQPSKKE